MLNCSFSCIALQSDITQHSIKFLVTAITGLSVAQTQFSVLHSSLYRTNWSLFLFEEHWPTSWALPIRVKQGAFHHLPFLWAAPCTIIKFVLAGNWVIHFFCFDTTQLTVDGHSKTEAGLCHSVLWYVTSPEETKWFLRSGLLWCSISTLCFNDVQFSHLIWLVLTAQSLKHILSL